MDGAEDEDVESVEGEVVEEKQDKKGSETAELDEKLTAALDQYKRLFAEFDNYRKRTEVEKSDMYASGIRKTVEKILPVLDNFERGLAAVPEADRKNSAYTGMEMIYKQMVKVLDDLGVKPIEAEGKEFDPNFHNAVMQVESDELESGYVAQVVQKGYTYKGKVIRFASVTVVA
ncbi:MAG: nucleotide exchange factor GrpE [Lachnospiraceae bacterium]|nr:nucleotide exchange factor GrpE [Lachnospiraceae bacterium]